MDSVRALLRSVRMFASRHWLPLTAGVVVVALIASAGIWWLASTDREGAVDAVDCSKLEASAFGTASAIAVACEAEVEVTGERTPWQTSWALPDGTSRFEAAAVPTRTLIDGAWVPVDSRLVERDDAIEVAAPVYPISLNRGGEQGAGKPLGTIEHDGYALQAWFPLELPVPTVEDSRVVYDLGDGIRLAVNVSADTTGFAPVVELADPAAAARFAELLAAARASSGAPGQGLDLGYTLSASGDLALSVDEDSQLHAVDASGDEQFSSPPPTMWDSAGATVIYGPEVTEVASTDRLVQPSGGDHVATMGASYSGDTLVVSPDEDMLKSPETVWPVYIDPSFSGVLRALRIAVRTGGYTSTLVDWTNISSTSLGEGTGYCSDTVSCNVVFKQRLIWRFNNLTTLANLAGTDILSATFKVNGVHSYNCEARTTWLWRTSAISASSTWGTVSWAQQLGARTESQRSSCSTNGYRTFDAKAGFVWAADANSTTISLGLRTDESSMFNWKRFAQDATISVTYNRAPAVPTSLQLTSPPVADCTTGIGRPAIATTTPTVSSIVSDPDATAVNASFEVAPVADVTVPVWSSGNITAITSGQRASAAVPSGTLVDGTAYAWRSRGFDGSRYSEWSGWCEFLVDTTAPSLPSVSPVTSGVPVAYPEDLERGGVGLQGTFTLSRNSDADVVSFEYGFNSPTLPSTVAPDANGEAVIAFTPLAAGPVTLTVRALDAAGNFSATRTYLFTVVTPTEDGIWSLDEGTGVTSADTAGNPPLPLTIDGAGWGSGPHALFDSRPGDFALDFDGVNDSASTTAPVIDTTDSFALSAHVLLDPSKVGGSQSLTALSQDGVDTSGFRLEYSVNCPGMADGCWSFAMPDDAAGSAETVVRSAVPVTAGEWTHLVAEFDAPAQQMRLWVCEIGTPADPAAGDPVSSQVGRTATPWPAMSPFQIGRSLNAGTATGYWAGTIDNVRVFSGEVVSEAKIRRLCQGAEAGDFSQGNNALDPTIIGG